MRYEPPEQPTTLKGAIVGAIVCGILGGWIFGDQVELEMRDMPE